MKDRLSRVTTKISKTLFDTKMFFKEKGNKYPLLFSLFGVLLSTLSVVGVTYSLWTDTAETGNNSISTGTISMRYVEDTSFASINNAEPMSAADAYQSNNYFPFQVVMEASGNAELNYEITVTTQNTTTFSYDTDQKIRIGLKKENNIVTDAGFNIEGNGDNVNYTNGVIVGTLPTSGSVTTGNPQTVYKGTISSNGTETVHNFKLYLWLDENAPANSVSEKYALTINVNTGNSAPNYQRYTLTYNNQGGLGCSTKQVRPNNPWGTLCTPAKEGYAFSGWYTGENGTGTEVTSTTTASSNTQVYAYYTPKTLYTVMESFAEEGKYAATYSGDSNDTYGVAGTKTIYYIKPTPSSGASTLLDKINVKFAGYCWQILRTTDTGGVKLIYNGEPDANGHCKAINTTDTHKGVIAASNGSAVAMSANYQYADSYTYDLDAGTFTLTNPSEDNYANNKNLIGKYTCRTNNTTTTCSTLYYLNTPNRETVNSPYVVGYKIGDTQNAQIGTSPFNANYMSPAYVGYKYGTAYDYVADSAPTSGSIMGHDVYWNGSNYELREANNSVSTGTDYDTDHHYTCNSTSATCTDGKVRYYYYGNDYIELLNGDDIDTALTRMLEANTYDSAMKSYLENWFRNKMLAYKDYLDENTIYCNDRTITQIGGWSNTGSITSSSVSELRFNNYGTVTNLSCTKDTDKFSVGNSNAELNYPVGLATAPEMNIITNATLRKTGQNFWLVSPDYSDSGLALERYVSSSGSMSYISVYYTRGARPVVSLAPSNDIISGTGAYDNPYVIGE